MSRHERPVPEGTRRRRQRAVIAVAAVAAVGAGAGVWATSGGNGPARAEEPAAAPTPTSPSPSRSYPLSKEPQTVPAVRDHTPARGPGWKPARGHRVVVDGSGLADEGRLLAGELGLAYAGQDDARAGDVRLQVRPDKGANPESYTMSVRDGRVTLSGPTEAGVYYGTRTLKQSVAGGAAAPEGTVRDEPAKPRRGFSLDIARKFFDAGWIEDRIRELGDLKYNELGLHFSDDQGFRVESSSHPEIVSTEHLTKAQVKQIVDLANSRHITVVPELDSPGHLGAVLDAHPDLQLRNAQGTPTRGAIDISKPAAGKIVDDLIDEYSDVFPGSQWHLGADEYQALTVSDPQASYPTLAAAARKAYGPDGTVADLTTGWLNARAKTVRDDHRTPRAWNDGFFKDTSVEPAKDIQVAYWTGKEIGARPPTEYLAAGRKVLNYNDEFLYYVLGQPQTFVYPTGQRIYEDWTPRVIRGTRAVDAKYDDQILGGSFAVWGDIPGAQTTAQVADGIRLPLAATVQKLWDPGAPKLSWTEFRDLADRLDQARTG
ncbi:glycoside hydrolase family 20 protein [Streptomyces sp. NPDC048182]|uniref:beta-N-acetylhexosaminidase n=1 Tax=Streptomyces sp. NPDC048182 TaxID=3365507 RepID=UPI003718E8AA